MRILISLLIVTLISLSSIAQDKNAAFYLDKAKEQINKEKYPEAIETLSIGIAEMPDSVLLYIMRANMFDTFQLYDKALKDFTQAIYLTDDDAFKSHVYANRGGMKAKLRDYDGAYKDFMISIELDSTNINAYNNLASIYDNLGKSDKAIKILNKIISIDSSYVAAYINLGFRYQKKNKHEQAIGYFNKALELEPDEPFSYSNRSFSKLMLGDLKGAMNDINKSIEEMPINSYAYKNRALIYIEKNKMNKACKDLNNAIERGFTEQYGDEVNKLLEKYCK